MFMLNKDYKNIKEVLEYAEYKDISFLGNKIKCTNLLGQDRELFFVKDGERIIIKPEGFMEMVRTEKHGQLINLELTSDDGIEVHLFDFGSRAIIEQLHKKSEDVEIEESDLYISETDIEFRDKGKGRK